MPLDEEKEIRKLKSGGKVVAEIGDGINNAPMLATADVGIVMGLRCSKGNRRNILVKDDIRDVVKAIELSRLTVSKIRQNLVLAFLYNVLSITIGAVSSITGLAFY